MQVTRYAILLCVPQIRKLKIISLLQKLIFESSEAVSVVSTFDDLGLKEDLLRGIYAYSTPPPLYINT